MPEQTLEEFEQATAVPAAPQSAADIKLEAADLPDGLRGQTAAELARQLEGLKGALRTSEEARLVLSESLKRGSAPAAPAAPAAPSLPSKTREELAEMMRDDPMQVIDYLSVHLAANMDQHFERRFKPIVEGSSSSMESRYRERYKDEFELFKDDIAAVKAQVNPAVLSTETGWDDIISYVRGRPGNFEKLVEKRTQSTVAAPSLELVRSEQRRDTGFTPAATRSSVVTDGAKNEYGLDKIQMEICEKAGWDPKEYAKNMSA